ncbi:MULTISPECIES: sensor histidine kinase [Galbibacter]|uniref:histidine kinase n=1 Tax=Galbibacter marinus TaxID=555500 RepID=K2P347_9FLAO|nr:MULTISPECIES: HAMP domain-containing sensor histidine kinase [Galbibacter]EKF55468.1 two-component system-sensor histidine kinase [Galbibacter marinus]HLV63371.1 HAMP domain-containing sensor histidine kinase [Galbibacter sp.]
MKKTTRWILIISSIAIVTSVLWNTYVFFQRFKEEERAKMTIWAEALGEFIQTTDLDRDMGNVTLAVMKNNTSTPIIYVGNEGEVTSNNLPENRVDDSVYIQRKIQQFTTENPPIDVTFRNTKYGTLYYGNSDVLNNLKYYPMALLLVIFLFAAVVYFFYRTFKVADQNKLWAGMAKETAHQIGTPLSSLLGWSELLKAENVNPEITAEIEKDIDRLLVITERFSKIGSVPALEKSDVVAETYKTFQYLELRSSKLVEFDFKSPEIPIYCDINRQLYSWTIENLIKNAIDAMKGKGRLTIEVVLDKKFVKINVIDIGKGIQKNDFHQIFEPGYTTKKRGWGLGLSLVKRIIEDYHNGRVRVFASTVGKGTKMQIVLKTTP